MKKNCIWVLIIIVLLPACLRLKALRRRGYRERKKITLNEYIDEKIDKKISGYIDQNRFADKREKRPDMNYTFDGSLIYKFPDNYEIYTRPKKREFKSRYGNFTEYSPKGWKMLVVDENQGFIIYDFEGEDTSEMTFFDKEINRKGEDQ